MAQVLKPLSQFDQNDGFGEKLVCALKFGDRSRKVARFEVISGFLIELKRAVLRQRVSIGLCGSLCARPRGGLCRGGA